MTKTYQTRVRLGAASDTDDAEGTITLRAVERPPDKETVERGLAQLVGEQEQVPPAFSAAKVTGRRAYALARRGEDVALKPRRVQVHDIHLLAFEYPRLELEVVCGKGTYIRSLARDLGERLACGGLVEALRRTRVGPFTADDALPLESEPTTAGARLFPLAAAVADLSRVRCDDQGVRRLRQGQKVATAALPGAEECAVFDGEGTLVAICRVEGASGLLHPVKVLPEREPCG
jgi:tRNA pseudouridine55 synthase